MYKYPLENIIWYVRKIQVKKKIVPFEPEFKNSSTV